MNRSELVEQIAEKAQTSKAAAARMMDALFDSASGAIAEAVRAGQQVSIPGFGKFRPKTRPARKGRNPRTGAEIDIPERTVVAFSPGKGLRDSLADGSAGQGTKRSSATREKAGKGSRAAGSKSTGKR